MRKPPRYFSLQRPKLRLSWNKYNVYNIARGIGADRSSSGPMTFFQMKWNAKARSRGYHGEHIAEKKWKRLFSHRLQSAVDLPPKYLAEHDGSEQAAGRGSGVSTNTITAEKYSHLARLSNKERITHGNQRKGRRPNPEHLLAERHSEMTPYMQMSYAPLERRLDMAVFRALFASSVRQARQFIIHGAVEVNGKKMVYPSYALNPGDMFQVQVEKVLYATGKQAGKANLEPKKERVARRQFMKRVEADEKKNPKEAKASANMKAFWKEIETLSSHPEFESMKNLTMNPHLVLQRLQQVQGRLMAGRGKLDSVGARLLQDLTTRLRESLGREADDNNFEEMVQDFRMLLKNRDNFFDELASTAKDDPAPAKAESTPATAADADAPKSQERRIAKATVGLTKAQATRLRSTLEGEQFSLSNEGLRELARVIRLDEENPYDPSKPYKTPWEPRDYMSAFAYIPRYLEVNPNICAAVYLRHPVARKGLGEVPTPFSYMTNQLVHNWYLARGPRMRT